MRTSVKFPLIWNIMACYHSIRGDNHMKFDMKIIGKRIYTARKNKNLRQADVCNALHISQSTLSKIENGSYNNLTLEMINNLSDLFDVSVVWLTGLDTESDLTHEENLALNEYKEFLIYRREKNKN